MGSEQIIEAELTWTGKAFESAVQIVVTDAGWIEHVGPSDVKPTHRLMNRAILPGFVNAHSHAFQRGLRGRGERFAQGSGSFWTWREEMYQLAESMDAAAFYQLVRSAFAEMLAAGITTVGEFHYLHHDASCRGYAFDAAILSAAREAGIRLVLLHTYYKNGGIGKPLAGAQRRFRSASLSEFWAQFDWLQDRLDPRTQSLGVAAHSIRAVPLDDLVALNEERTKRGLVLHMHLEEQPQELTECRDAYGQTPLALVQERLRAVGGFTAVHCTQTDGAALRRLAAGGALVCICPLTEANLGDGAADVPAILGHGGRICIGTDSNSRICMTEELRWLEYVQRVERKVRGVCADATGSSAVALWDMATVNGAKALGIKAGRIQAGYLADFLLLDLASPSLGGWKADSLLDSFIFGTGNEAIVSTCVGGHWTRPPELAKH